MGLQIAETFVNMPVKNLKKSVEFFSEIGFEFNPEYTYEDIACLIISGKTYVMLMKEDSFKDFTGKEIPDTTKNSDSVMCLSVESKEKVHEIVSKVTAAGGNVFDPKEQGAVYGQMFQDLDDHLWEIIYVY